MATLTAPPPRAASPRRRTRSRRPQFDAAALVGRAALGDERAWQDLVKQFEGVLAAIARAYRLGDAEAADVAQTTWLRLVERLTDLHEPDRVGAWLATTARRECLRVLRQSRRQVAWDDTLADECASGNAEPAGWSILRTERDDALRRALASLRPHDRALLALLTSDLHPSYEEIGATLQVPVGSIGPTRARALARLRRELERSGQLALMFIDV